ncbi:branched-chain amino acid aminotransferase [Salisediminibacterium selenitireducens]|uniref:branched-chain-amino-acid transaminase n=1 Tax=Bacillus selenitireducens (strain ATCC 700615 / DSM 15326 / MLS10) TaxID=439292 RepID=D6XUH8_BACIE|nr:branched-chain amino acid aminotransferase [Salisediminibacterium selenitireducens]ADH99464.1 branched-chain amino acid aminotransferase [[Bacillus] selenitireducens MLS10]
MSTELKWTKTDQLKPKPDETSLPFGRIFTDYMLKVTYDEGQGWSEPHILPYGPIELDPAAMVLHYGQTVFEGLKAYRTTDGHVQLFRPDENMKRMNRSHRRMSIPEFDEDRMLKALIELVNIEKDWVPSHEGTSLYIRPFVISTEANLAVHPSKSYEYYIILSPVGSYYPEGINPVKIQVEDEFTRAVKGGTGTAKTGGNYSAGYNAQEKASKSGHAQVLWLDAIEKQYIEEVGSMNVLFKIDGEIVTPALSGSILEGVTRKSILELLHSWDIPVLERKISIRELIQAQKDGTLEEAFGAGTAAVVSPIGSFTYKGESYQVQSGETGELTKKLYETITGIQTGKIEDPFDWTIKL